ncbi:hypothetical protein [Burkholderia ubonensis]|uniref:Uncharacterized protein n=1 Tax=Burkholderia ubonensis TaxID=101571 RepID=A0A107F470_9BURK|nr:hypothetical protein [Burkholderia ubonensis]KWD71343.1 hypothetical protein WL70_30135 [Burkholderia ubonensis]KWD86645.1 hypothetical protein WL71_12615 [Burkholderia ubonensis]KWD98112.1 hypothetical protein WL72_17770 [Burkholderia ubonensis]KWE01132.1 hypothetical protein WL73_16315 [Burkholderia ubonensis]MDY7787928.1 hypothetical protein [Burkholderia ubonensis]
MLKRILSRTDRGEQSDAPPAAPRRLRTLLLRSAGFGLAMQDALQSVPAATIDGELYETAHVPGNGFVPAIGATPPDLADTATRRGTSPPAPAPASEAAISADERARILGYFDSP